MSEGNAGAPAPTPAAPAAAPSNGAKPATQPSATPEADLDVDALSAAADATGGDPEPLDIEKLPDDLSRRKVRMVIDGKEQLVPLADALKGSRRFKAATEKEMRAAQEARRAQSEAARFLKDPQAYTAKAGPEGVEALIKHVARSGSPEVKAALNRALESVLAENEMPPEKQAHMREAEDIARQRRELAEERQAAQKQQEARDAGIARQRYERDIGKAMRAKKMPTIPVNVAAVAQVLGVGLRRGVEMTPEDAIDLIQDERKANFAGHFEGVDGDDLLSLLGDDVVRRVNAATIARAKLRQQNGAAKPAAQTRPSQPKADDFISTDDIRKKWGYGY